VPVPDTGTETTTEVCEDTGSIPQTEWGQDADGYIAIEHGGDGCDDRSPSSHPGAREQCDPWDHDCDGQPLAPGVCADSVPIDDAASF
jgi:hypothetical protein